MINVKLSILLGISINHSDWRFRCRFRPIILTYFKYAAVLWAKTPSNPFVKMVTRGAQFALLAITLTNVATAADFIPVPAKKPSLKKEFSKLSLSTKVLNVQPGDTLSTILQSAGVKKNDAANAISELSNIFPISNLRVGQKIYIFFEDKGKKQNAADLASIQVRVSPETAVEVIKQNDGVFLSQEVDAPVKPKLAMASGVIKHSLFTASQKAGVPDKVVIDLIKKYSYDVDFQRDIQPGDSFEILYEKMYDEYGKFITGGEIIYASLKTRNKELDIFRYETPDGEVDYYDGNGESIRKALLKTPIDGAQITSVFGKRRHPILGYNKMHKGLDFGAPTGTPVYAAGDGVVVEAERKGSYGNYIKIRHSNGFSTAYAHLNKFDSDIRGGAKVKQGQVIAYVGTTGRSTGPHLHYELIQDGLQIDPLSIKTLAGKTLQGIERGIFARYRGDINQAMAKLSTKNKFASSAKN